MRSGYGRGGWVNAAEAAVDRDTFMSASEAVTFGLIDRVLEKREATPVPASGPVSPLP